MEGILENSRNRGALIIGNPGAGKSAFLSNLLCSTTSSPTVHYRILAHHFCMHYNKATQDGAKFVQNLANMIAWKLSGYHEYLLRNSFVRRVLQRDCSQDPEWCFELGVLTPLKNLHPQPSNPWYIIIDALDECVSDKAEIVNILKSKAHRLPKWMKLIVSSRNLSTIISGLGGFQSVELRSDDDRNREDIDTYLSLKMFSLSQSMVQKIKTSLAILDNDNPNQKMVSTLAEKGQGNFLYVKVVLDLWLTSTENDKWETFPKTLESSYQLYFERKYSTPESFQSLRQIFEVLVSAYTPLTVQEMYSLFQLDQPSLDLEYEFLPRLDEVSLFLWHGSEDGLIRIHHSSLSEWLTSEINKGKFYYVKKQNGHNRLARYYLLKAEENNSPLKPREALYLTSHIVEGGLNKSLEQKFLSVPSEHINTTDPLTQTTALHHSSDWLNTDVTKLLMQHFSDVDCPDNKLRTPCFIAATSGHVNIVKALFERGADLDHTTSCLDIGIASYSLDPVRECKRTKCGYSLLHSAAQEGRVSVVQFLVQHNVSLSKTTGANNTAIQLAAAYGHLKTVETLKEAGGVLDGTCLHHAAVGGHKEIVQYLLQEGVRDSCISSTPPFIPSVQKDKKFISSECYVYDNLHIYLRETALHAAVKKGHLSVIGLLLNDLDQSAINCTNSAGRLPQHEAVHLRKYNALEVLLAFGATPNVGCDTVISPPLPIILGENRCHCGFTPLHIAAMYGHQSIAQLLIENKADVNAGDCNGSTPLHVASCQDMSALVVLLVKNGADINSRSLNGSTPLHIAAACFGKSVFYPLFGMGCDHLLIDNEGMTALHYIVKDVNITITDYLTDLYVRNPKDWIENPRRNSHHETMDKLDRTYPWLNTLAEVIRSFTAAERKGLSPFLEMEDKKNQTVFSILEEKTNASSLLIGSRRIRGLSLVLSLTPFLFAYDTACYQTAITRALPLKNQYSSSIPISFKSVISKTLTSLLTNINCSTLTRFVKLRLVHTVNTVLQASAVDVNCRDDLGITPLLMYLRTGGRHMAKVLVKHDVEVKIICGDPFEISTFHLISYHKLHYLHYLHEFFLGSDNWQKYLVSKDAMFDYFLDNYEQQDDPRNGTSESVRTGVGVLTKAILSHPNGSKVIDECFDEEGYNALQRASQGANFPAIQKFLSLGANPFLETANGFSPLWLSVLHAVKYRPFLNFENPSIMTALEVELASLSASTLLNHILENRIFDVGCDASRSDLTLYHIAASRGMWQFVAHLLSSKKVTGIDVNCPNEDGITPLYLATIIGGDSCQIQNSWCKVGNIIKSHGGTLQFPTMEAEYFLIFNIFFGMNPSYLFLELTEEEILALNQNCERGECQEYHSRKADIFKTSDKVDRVHNSYQTEVDKCSRFIEECPPDIKTELCHFSYVMLLFDKLVTLKCEFLLIRNSFIRFLDKEIERLKHLLHTATRPHLEMTCIPEPPPEGTFDMCNEFSKPALSVHDLYRNYKQKLDLVMENSNEVKSSMTLNGRLPRYLRKMNSVLNSYDKTLNCDWQVVAMKYIQLIFQVRNFNIWQEAVSRTQTVPSVSEFLSQRMTDVILQPADESLRLVLKLAYKKSFETFNYLRILRFTKPPFWSETFSGVGNFG